MHLTGTCMLNWFYFNIIIIYYGFFENYYNLYVVTYKPLKFGYIRWIWLYTQQQCNKKTNYTYIYCTIFMHATKNRNDGRFIFICNFCQHVERYVLFILHGKIFMLKYIWFIYEVNTIMI